MKIEDISKYLSEPTESGCKTWLQSLNHHGYGKIWFQNKHKLAHRVVFELAKGPIPPLLQVLHKCDNPPCCEITHLFLGTQLENVRDCNDKNRRNLPHGEKHHNSKLTHITASEILEKYKTGLYSNKALAREYGVSASLIAGIGKRQTWKHLDAALSVK